MSGAWPAVLSNLVVVLGLSSIGFLLAEQVADGAARYLAFWAIGGVIVFVVVAAPLRWFLMQQRRDADDREAMLRLEAQRREFDARLARALDMTDAESAALEVAGRALAELAPSMRSDLLLADSSQAHLTTAVQHAPAGSLPGCDVSTPKACPAVRNGHAVRFPDDRLLDACPHLAGRAAAAGADGHGDGSRTGCGAVCVPVSIMGSTVGVLHAVHRVDDAPDDRTLAGLEIVAQQVGSRIGLLSAMAQSQMQANTDALTGLLNRRSLENEVRILVRKGTPFALVLADLDHFKVLNDTFGHDMGDRALRLFGRTLSRSTRDSDLVARYGGEEFVVVMPEVDAAGAVAAFDRVRMELEVALSDGRIPPFTVSAGVADTAESTSLEELVMIADGHLLRAKRTGRNRVLHGAIGDELPTLASGQLGTAALDR